MKRTLEQIFEHMLEDCDDIEECVLRAGSRDGMDNDNIIRKAIVFSILNLGELTKLLEVYVDITQSDIHWKGLKGMRDIAAHRYKSMDSNIIWDVASQIIPVIKIYLVTKRGELTNAQLKQLVRER